MPPEPFNPYKYAWHRPGQTELPKEMRMVPLVHVNGQPQAVTVLEIVGSFDGITIYRDHGLRRNEIRFSSKHNALIVGADMTLDDVRFEFSLTEDDWNFLHGIKVKI